MPYFNSLAQKYGLATQYYANTHPSIGNYFKLTTGQTITNNDSYSGTVSSNNIVRELITAGKTWKSYAESLPYTGYTGGDRSPYSKHHNPFAYFTDVVNSSTEKLNLVSFSQLKTDMAVGNLPDFSFIVPNMNNDAHNGSLSTADSWLKNNIGPILSSSTFQKDGLMVIVFDESSSSDTSHGGGHVAMLVIGPNAKRSYKSTTFYQHQSTLKLILQSLGVSSYPGAASTAPSMREFFPSTTTSTTTTSSCSAPSSYGIHVCSPTNGSSVSSPVAINATAKVSGTIYRFELWLGGTKLASTSSTVMQTSVNVSSGTLTFVARNTSGTRWTQSVTVQ